LTNEFNLNTTQCQEHTNVMVGKSGKCHRRDFCNEKGSNKCGEVLSLSKKLTYLKEFDALKKVV